MQSPKDVAILFALREEFAEFRSEVESFGQTVVTAFIPEVDNASGRSFFIFEIKSQDGTAYRCVASFVDTMGAQDASYFTGALIDRYDPRTVVLLGIAGSLSEGVLVGDIVVADQVDDYLQDARYGEQGFSLSGRVYRPNARLANFGRYFVDQHKLVWENISRRSAADIQKSIPSGQISKIRDAVRIDGLTLHVGHLASGPIVGAAESYKSWLRQRDRRLLAIEMEAAGVMNAIYQRGGDQRALVIRGISDLADNRKSLLDQVKHGVLRSLATRNAASLLIAFLRSGLLERINEPPRMPNLPVGERSMDQWIDDLLGSNPITGNRAVQQITSNPERYMPLLGNALHRSFNLQRTHRMQVVFGKAGKSGIDTLVSVLNSNDWDAMGRAAKCFKYIPQYNAAEKVAELITDSTSRMDVTRRAFEALGWMGATLYRSKIWHTAMGSDDYAFEKLSFFAYRAFILMTVNARDQSDAFGSMKLISDLLKVSDEDRKFGEGYDPEREWQDHISRLTPQAEDALLEWLDESDDMLRHLALMACSRSENPRLLSRMLQALARTTSSKEKVAIAEYLKTQDTDEGYEAANQLLSDAEFSGYGLAMLSCMMYRLDDEKANAVLAKIDSGASPRARVQALYTLGRPLAKGAFAPTLLDHDDVIARGAAAIALASRLGSEARQAVQARQPHATDPIERALMCAAAVRCGVPGSADVLHEALAQIPDPFLMEYLWRRELVFAISREGPDAEERGQAWGELFNVNFQLAEEQVSRFAPFTSTSTRNTQATTEPNAAEPAKSVLLNLLRDQPKLNSKK